MRTRLTLKRLSGLFSAVFPRLLRSGWHRRQTSGSSLSLPPFLRLGILLPGTHMTGTSTLLTRRHVTTAVRRLAGCCPTRLLTRLPLLPSGSMRLSSRSPACLASSLRAWSPCGRSLRGTGLHFPLWGLSLPLWMTL